MSVLHQTFQQCVKSTWGNVPDWIDALARSCDTTSQRKTASLLGLSPAVVNLLIHNKYAPRSHHGVELLIKKRLMATSVQCPVIGTIDRNACRKYQALPLNTHNPAHVQIYRACRNGCQHSFLHSHSKHPVNGLQSAIPVCDGEQAHSSFIASSKHPYGENPEKEEG